jgi:hypothetical protein
MKQKHCFLCGKPLSWIEFRKTNYNKSLWYLKKLWNSSEIEFFCCECFKQEARKEKIAVELNREKD